MSVASAPSSRSARCPMTGEHRWYVWSIRRRSVSGARGVVEDLGAEDANDLGDVLRRRHLGRRDDLVERVAPGRLWLAGIDQGQLPEPPPCVSGAWAAHGGGQCDRLIGGYNSQVLVCGHDLGLAFSGFDFLAGSGGPSRESPRLRHL